MNDRTFAMSEPLPTEFAPAERAQPHEVAAQATRFLETSADLQTILDAVPDVVLMLNRHRQIIFANRSTTFLLNRGFAEVLGLRPGEALNCIHAYESQGGCGTTAFCSTCGAVRAILASQRGLTDVQECRILVRDSSDALDLRVWAVPYQAGGEKLTIFTVQDIRDEKRRLALERIFFHDVLNTAGTISFALQLMTEMKADAMPDLPEMLTRLTDQLIEEIKSQRDLLSAENHELIVQPDVIDLRTFLPGVVETYRQHEVAQGRHIRLALPDEQPTFVSDPALLRRVLGNMLKNALEATPAGETVTLGYRFDDGQIEFWVHNPTVMPRDVQLQVFQRSFSTKGRGRGLGTYSIKLLSERYLQGKVSFESSPATGTIFRAIYPLQITV
ncbi:MAG: PAS domain-containing sensor histidine kinase [Anaerolineae bacterium]|nr:PAS domain-containing sensor histidine kinase [Anaerolineae bacterium]